MSTFSRKWTIALGVLLLSSAAGVGAVATTQVEPTARAAANPMLIGIRTGAHPTYDRIVLDFAGPAPRVSSRFVDQLIQDGSGNVEPLDGNAFAEVQATPAQAHDDAGRPSYPGPRKFKTPALSNAMAVALTGDFEGVVTLGVGMRRQAPVTVFTLANPTRVVIDVAHPAAR